MNNHFCWIKEWDDSLNLVRADYLGHETVLAPDMVRITYRDGLSHIVTESYFNSIYNGFAAFYDINPMPKTVWSPRIK